MRAQSLPALLLPALWSGIAPAESLPWPALRHAAHASPEVVLPGNRPERPRASLAAPAPAYPALAYPALTASALTFPAPEAASTHAEVLATAVANGPDPPAGERDCEAALRLPWGPIGECSQAVIAVAVGATAVVSLYSWWHQGFDSDFNVSDEGWFGANTNSGGIDKLGHAWTFYVGTRLGTRALGWAGVPHGDSIRLAAGIGLGVGLGIEVFDGLSRGGRYGFSWQDIAMNVVGTGFGMLMESRPELDRHLAFRWMYRAGGDQWYDHHLYLLAWRFSGLNEVGRNNPLRYLELLVGYGAQGFRSDMDYSAGDTRKRSVYLGVGLNLTEVLDRWVFSNSRGSRAQRWTEEALRYVQVPGTAVGHSWDKRP